MSQGYREYEIDPIVFVQARQIGLIGNLQQRLQRMARRSAPFTHKEGNRRFESYIMRIEKGVVRSIRRFDPETGEVVVDVLGKVEQKLRERTMQAIDKHLGQDKDEDNYNR